MGSGARRFPRGRSQAVLVCKRAWGRCWHVSPTPLPPRTQALFPLVHDRAALTPHPNPLQAAAAAAANATAQALLDQTVAMIQGERTGGAGQ